MIRPSRDLRRPRFIGLQGSRILDTGHRGERPTWRTFSFRTAKDRDARLVYRDSLAGFGVDRNRGKRATQAHGGLRRIFRSRSNRRVFNFAMNPAPYAPCGIDTCSAAPDRIGAAKVDFREQRRSRHDRR